MGRVSRPITVVTMTVAVLTLASCASPSFSLRNDGDEDAEVNLGDTTLLVAGSGGAVIMDYDCTPGDVTVTLADGTTVELPGPICSDQEILIGNTVATVRERPEPQPQPTGHS